MIYTTYFVYCDGGGERSCDAEFTHEPVSSMTGDLINLHRQLQLRGWRLIAGQTYCPLHDAEVPGGWTVSRRDDGGH